jgi:hypothetical protein
VRKLTRRAALAALATSGLLGVGYVFRGIFEAPVPASRLNGTGDGGGGMMGGGMMGNVGAADLSIYMDMFNRHNEISRVVQEIPGGVRTTTQSDVPELAAQLKAHVSSMYSDVEQRAEIMCMSDSLPILFRRADGYRRQLTFTPTGVIAEETSEDPAITHAIRAHAREVTGFVRDGMPAMMHGMMGPG